MNKGSVRERTKGQTGKMNRLKFTVRYQTKAARQWVQRLLIAALIALACGTAHAEQYRLAPGDQLLVRIIELNDLAYVTKVDTAGNIRLPYLGTHPAANKTLDELQQGISSSVAGRQFQLVRDGTVAVVVLNQQDIFLDIEAYRPVAVVGAVAAPGRIPFEPGLTVRSAIGAAGGSAQFAQIDGANQLPNLRTRLAELREREAWLASDLWRIHLLLTEAPTESAPDGEFAVVADGLDEPAINSIRERVEAARATLEREREESESRIALTTSRIEFLETAFEQFKVASELAEQRLQDILALSNRGLTTADAVKNAREGALNASSRLLTTQADLADTQRELQTFVLLNQALDTDFRADLLSEQARVQRTYEETRISADSLSRELLLGFGARDDSATATLQIMLHRMSGGQETSTSVPLSTVLQPGDVVEVIASFQ